LRADLHRRILLVDDEPSVRDLLRTFLELRGFVLTVASTAREAFAASAGARFDLLVIDIHLPDGAGSDVAYRLRQQQPGMRVVFISGAPDVTADLVERGSDPVLTKPFSMRDLDRVVRATLDRAA
jgi:two-component system phosphate regulon response regulator OmpR